MPLKELSASEQIRILQDLDSQEKIYDRNLSLVKGDLYSLKHKHNISIEPEPLEMIHEVYRQQPTIEAIKTVSKQLRKAQMTPSTGAPLTLEERPKEEPITLPPDDDKEHIILRKHNFPTMKDVEDQNLDVADLIVRISNYNKSNLGVKLATLTRSGRKDSEEYQAIQGEIQVLKNFKNRLLGNFERQRVMLERIGEGLPPKVGKYYVDAKSLKQGMLKLRKKNKAKIKGIDDTVVTEGLKQLLFKRFNPKASYTADDFRKYKQLCDLTGHHPKQHSQLRNKIYVTTVVDAQTRLVNAIGELKAGNRNKNQ